MQKLVFLFYLFLVACDSEAPPVLRVSDSKSSELSVTFHDLDNIINSNVTKYIVSGKCSEKKGLVNVAIKDKNSLGIKSTTKCSDDLEWQTDSVDVTILADGEVSIVVKHFNVKGDKSAENSTQVQKGNIIEISIDRPLLDITDANVAQYVVSGDCSAGGGRITVYVENLSTEQTVVSKATCPDTGEYRVELNVETLSDGEQIEVRVYHSNNAGESTNDEEIVRKNTSAPPSNPIAQATVNIDSQPPIMNNVATYRIRGACSEEGVEVTVDVGGVFPGTQPKCTQNGRWISIVSVSSLSALSDPVTITATHSGATDTEVVRKFNGILSVITSVLITSTNAANYRIEGTCLVSGSEVTVDVGGVSPGTQPTCDLNKRWSSVLNVVSLPNNQFITITLEHEGITFSKRVQKIDPCTFLDIPDFIEIGTCL